MQKHIKNRLCDYWLLLIEYRIWIALGAVGVVLCSYQVAGCKPGVLLLLCVFVGTWLMYFLQRYIPRFVVDWEQGLVKVGVFFAGLMLLAVVTLLICEQRVRVYGVLMVSALPAVLYSARYQSKAKIFNGLRQVPYIKILLIALVWQVLVLLPWIEHGSWQKIPWAYACMMFCYLIAITIPFDIRDMQTDDVNMQTIAQILGRKKASVLSYVLLLIALLCCWILHGQQLCELGSAIWFSALLCLSAYVNYTKPSNTDLFYYEGMLDGTLLLWGVNILLG